MFEFAFAFLLVIMFTMFLCVTLLLFARVELRVVHHHDESHSSTHNAQQDAQRNVQRVEHHHYLHAPIPPVQPTALPTMRNTIASASYIVIGQPEKLAAATPKRLEVKS